MLVGAYSDMTGAECVIEVSPKDKDKAGRILNTAIHRWGATEWLEEKGWDPYAVGWGDVAYYHLDKEKLMYKVVNDYDEDDVWWCHEELADLPPYE